VKRRQVKSKREGKKKLDEKEKRGGDGKEKSSREAMVS